MKTFELQKDNGGSLPPPPFLRELNEQQSKAVTHTDGPLLIIAGAGSGKTRVLTFRIAYLLHQQKALPSQILALTFTNKAAREMQERIGKLIDEKASKLWMGTFHSVFAKFLRVDGSHIGYKSNFSIYDTSDAETIIKRILTELRYDVKQIRPKVIQRKISDAKNQLVLPDQYEAKFARSTLDQITAKVYHIYEERLRLGNAMDFDDLLIKPIELFERHPDILAKYQTHFRYILIDEYQDTNHAQYKATRLLAGERGNICVVGDDAQSIYSFRGADIRNILDFKKDYEDAVEVPLEQNYRSTRYILQCADSIIKRNSKQLDKTLWTQNENGDPIVLMEHLNEREEAQRVASMIETLRGRHQINYNDFAILYRTNYQSRVFEEALRRNGIPYQLVGGLSFYQRKEIKDVLAYLTMLVNPEDDQSLLRIINEPSRGIGSKTINELLRVGRESRKTLWEIITNPQSSPDIELPRPAIGRIAEFAGMIRDMQRYISDGASILDVTRRILEQSGYMKALIEENSHESLSRRDNVIELQNAISYYEQANPRGSLGSFLQEISLVTDADKYDENKPAITMMTIHASKGLEFPTVFIVGLEEDLFPMGGRDGEEADIEEERRLFYVAITRAQKRLFFSTCQTRYRFGDESYQMRSRFLDEVDPGVVRNERGGSITQKPDRFGGGGTSSGKSPFGAKPSAASSPKSDDIHIEYDDHSEGFSDQGAAQVRSAQLGADDHIEADADAGLSSSHRYGEDPFQAGVEVIHPTFGQGRIVQRSGTGSDARVVVFFRDRGQKTLMLRAAKLRVR